MVPCSFLTSRLKQASQPYSLEHSVSTTTDLILGQQTLYQGEQFGNNVKVSDELWLNNWQLLALQGVRSELVFISAGNYPCLQGSYVCVTTSRDIAALIEFCLPMAQHR